MPDLKKPTINNLFQKIQWIISGWSNEQANLKGHKWKRRERIVIFQTVGELLQDGLPLYDAISFLQIMWPKHHEAFSACRKSLQKGHSFSESLQLIGFPTTYLGRLALAQEGSYLTNALLQCAKEEQMAEKYEEELKQVLIYPLLLIIAVIGLLLIIRQVLLPQMKALVSDEALNSSLLIRIVFFSIQFLPQIIILQAIFTCLFIILFTIWKEKKSSLHVLRILCHIPILKRLIRNYITWQFSIEIGRLMEQGLSFFRILDLLKKPPSRPFICEMASIISNQSSQGLALPDIIQQFIFLRAETAFIIQQGEQISQQSRKMILFSQQSQHLFLNDLRRLIQWIQPILFGLVALIIVSVYIILLLPMLSSFQSSF